MREGINARDRQAEVGIELIGDTERVCLEAEAKQTALIATFRKRSEFVPTRPTVQLNVPLSWMVSTLIGSLKSGPTSTWPIQGGRCSFIACYFRTARRIPRLHACGLSSGAAVDVSDRSARVETKKAAICVQTIGTARFKEFEFYLFAAIDQPLTNAAIGLKNEVQSICAEMRDLHDLGHACRV